MSSILFPDHIIFGDHAIKTMNSRLAWLNPSKVFFLVDENTHENCLLGLLQDLPDLGEYEVLEIEPGEESKNPEIVANLWSALAELGADRNALLINVGGGVVTDLGGFVAATYKRGLKFWNVPTSLLGMVDAALGDKTGIDVDDIKNLAGTFSPAEAIFVYPGFLETLPENHIRSGFAEIIKHGLIAEETHWLAAFDSWQVGRIDHIIERSAAIKLKVVDADAREAGQRKILNFGHTIGHALESYFLHMEEPVLHGDAVAAGMLAESFISTKRTGLNDDDFEEIVRKIDSVFDRLSWPESQDLELIRLMGFDKKNSNGQLKFSLLRQIGQATYDVEVTPEEVEEALAWYRLSNS